MNINGIILVEEKVIGGESMPVVDARKLHAFLNVGKDFSTWIANRIKDGGFIEGIDFSPVLGKSIGGRPSKEYSISLDMAKHLCMLERNENGKKARQYFVECEKKLRNIFVAKPISETCAFDVNKARRDLILSLILRNEELKNQIDESNKEIDQLMSKYKAERDFSQCSYPKASGIRPKNYRNRIGESSRKILDGKCSE